MLKLLLTTPSYCWANVEPFIHCGRKAPFCLRREPLRVRAAAAASLPAHLQGFLEHGGSRQEENSRGGLELSLPQQDVGILLSRRPPPRGAKVMREEFLEALALRGALRWQR